jgi:hypothetical protein
VVSHLFLRVAHRVSLLQFVDVTSTHELGDVAIVLIEERSISILHGLAFVEIQRVLEFPAVFLIFRFILHNLILDIPFLKASGECLSIVETLIAKEPLLPNNLLGQHFMVIKLIIIK